MALTDLAVSLAVVALVLLLVYMLYSSVNKAFRAVGFTPPQASALLLGLLIATFLPPIPLWFTDTWTLAIDPAGGLFPVVVSLWLLRGKPSLYTEAGAAVAVTSLVAYLVVTVTPEGIVAPIHLAILPVLTASAVSLAAHWRTETYAASLAFVGGALGALVGADLLHVPDFLAQAPPAGGPAVAVIGGAGVLDMVFLSAILAVTLDLMFFHRLRKEHREGGPWTESDVFTTSTPPEVIRDWLPPSERGPSRLELAKRRLEEARRAAAEAKRKPPAAAPPTGGKPPPIFGR